ncbi:GDSL-like Lipase/Acylhydrolase [Gracilibacillus orientalis]|uniref:GDSL-like Lipase/Acylhydrolase n=1 Tax=Gracilibacillus orientalis TaxID=334253 RepID=A0A1I4PHQ4_9BACI|nr:CapA family protein [Gracilibacillus orientalis]SFM27076.1 GDSL-like Lipase/Acylhydrolase [Gracilibacillus orientalis]
MDHKKKILSSSKNYKITYYYNEEKPSNKCVIAFGEIDSNMEEVGFGQKLVLELGYDYIYVSQRRRTQYQLLDHHTFYQHVKEIIAGKEVYTYGSSLGAYCAIYYGSFINANILSMSPRIPAHPVIDKLMGSRYKNNGFKHNELDQVPQTTGRISIFYDDDNEIDSYYINYFVKDLYPNAEYFHIKYAGHYTARALLLSDELKKTARDFFANQPIEFKLNQEEILNWHMMRAGIRLEKRQLEHAKENLDVLLDSNRAESGEVMKLVKQYKKKAVQKAENKSKTSTKPSSIIYPSITNDEQQKIKDAVSISFVGDLLLLRDQVFNAWDFEKKEYVFDDMFEYVKKYLASSDFSMGVLEGTFAGDTREYSTDIYEDKMPLHLNFPDSFAHAMKRAGFDFLTTAQNHLLDNGKKGAMRTLDVLDDAGIMHKGSYRNQEEKDTLPIYDIKGLKVAILTYTKRSNRYKNEFFLKEENDHLTSLLVSPTDPHFEEVKQSVKQDFERVKNAKPDCIVVLPHMGKQFTHKPDKFQRTWCDIFVDAGANIILSDHAHAVQPYEWRKHPEDNSDVLILHCPGDFVNSYTKKDGDASALSEIYLNPENGKPFAVSCVPLWAHSYVDRNYRALPIYEVIHNKQIRSTLSTYDYERVKTTHQLITKTMLGEELTIDQIQEKYYLFAKRADGNTKGYVRNCVKPLSLDPKMRAKKIIYLIQNSKSVCFIGDSITEGTKNGGYSWYEPLMENFEGIKVKKFARGQATPYFVKNSQKIADIRANLYIIAVGTNDVRYRDPQKCAMTSNEYIDNLQKIIKKIKAKKKNAKFIFIAPWTTDQYDPTSELSTEERFKMLQEYSKALKSFCDKHEHLYIDPNETISQTFKTRNPKKWLVDHIHPNASDGINLYSKAVIDASPNESLIFLRKAKKKLKQWIK